VVRHWSLNTECDTFEPPETRDDREDEGAEGDVLRAVAKTMSTEDELVDHVAGHEDGEVKGGEL